MRATRARARNDKVGDLDEHHRAISVRWTIEESSVTGTSTHPTHVCAALVATLPPREDSEIGAPLFGELTDPPLAHSGYPRLPGDRHAELLAARATPPARIGALQAHGLARKPARIAEAGSDGGGVVGDSMIQIEPDDPNYDEWVRGVERQAAPLPQ